jgi:hypothetical protein
MDASLRRSNLHVLSDFMCLFGSRDDADYVTTVN